MDKIKILPFDADEHIFVGPGDYVVTKYGDTLQVETYDEVADTFTFRELDPHTGQKYTYGTHRISYLISEKEYLIANLDKELGVTQHEYYLLEKEVRELLDIQPENEYQTSRRRCFGTPFIIDFNRVRELINLMEVANANYQAAVVTYQAQRKLLDEKYGPDVWDENDYDDFGM